MILLFPVSWWTPIVIALASVGESDVVLAALPALQEVTDAERSTQDHLDPDTLPDVVPTPPEMDLLAWEDLDPGPPPEEGLRPMRVVDAIGRPIPGAVLIGSDGKPRVTDGQGRAWAPPYLGMLCRPPAQQWLHNRVNVSAPGFAPVCCNEPCNVVRMVSRGGWLTGTCVDERGRPLTNVALCVKGSTSSPGLELRTDSMGRFSTDQAPYREQELMVTDPNWCSNPLLVVPPQGDIRIVASPRGIEKVGYPHCQVSIPWDLCNLSDLPRSRPVRARQDLMKIHTDSHSSLEGNLLDPAGHAIQEGRIELRWHGTLAVAALWHLETRVPPPWRASIRSYPKDMDGTYDSRSGRLFAARLAPGRFDLVWASPFYDQAIVLRRDIHVPEEPRAIDLGTIHVRFAPKSLLVRVLDSGRKAIPGAIVRLPIGPGHTAARTNREGRVQWSIYDPTALEVFVSADGFLDASRKLLHDEVPEVVEFVLERRF